MMILEFNQVCPRVKNWGLQLCVRVQIITGDVRHTGIILESSCEVNAELFLQGKSGFGEPRWVSHITSPLLAITSASATSDTLFGRLRRGAEDQMGHGAQIPFLPSSEQSKHVLGIPVSGEDASGSE